MARTRKSATTTNTTTQNTPVVPTEAVVTPKRTVAVAGSFLMNALREEFMAKKLVNFGYKLNPTATRIITTDAKGVAEKARSLGKALGMDVQQFKADWDNLGAMAQMERALIMAQEADGLVVISDTRGKNGETNALIKAFTATSKPVNIVDLSPTEDAEKKKAAILAAIAAAQAARG